MVVSIYELGSLLHPSFVTWARIAGFESIAQTSIITTFIPWQSLVAEYFDTHPEIVADLNATRHIILHHFVRGIYYSEDLKPGMELPTLAGTTLTIGQETASGSISLSTSGLSGNQAFISIADTLTQNGVFNVIDRVLVPHGFPGLN